MPLPIKNDPREWRKFVLLCCGILLAAAGWLYYRRFMPGPVLAATVVALLMIAISACRRPRWYGGFYRAVFRISGRIGEVLGQILLTLVYLLVVTPLALILRLRRMDLLDLRPDRSRSTRWKPGRPFGKLTNPF